MTHLRQRRIDLGLTQADVAKTAGLSRQQYVRIEQGLALPGKEQAARLTEILGTALLHGAQTFSDRQRRAAAGYTPYRLETVSSEPWRVFEQTHGVAMGVDRATWDWLRTYVHCDSSFECGGHCDIVRGGARPMVDSPLLWGFERHVLLDSKGQLLGARVLPCLHYQEKDVQLIFWPQVTLRTERGTLRVDGLMIYWSSQGRYWCVVEFDGLGHQGEKDPYPAQMHQMPEIRFSSNEIRGRRCLELLLERAQLNRK